VAKEQGRKVVASNRKARHDYLIEDTFEAGLVLMGTEVKSLRMGRASLIDGYAAWRGDELWLEGVHIPEYVNGNWTNHTPRRRRKLLLHRAELGKIQRKSSESGHTIVPLQLYFKDGKAKVEIAIAKGKRQFDKRQTLRERQDTMDAQRALHRRGPR
jgi:SsrA-binding protein